MPDGVKFDIQPKMIRKLTYRTKFHNFIMNIGNPVARASYYVAGSARITTFMFERRIDMQHCIDYFHNEFFPRYTLKNSKRMLADAYAMLDMSQARVDQIEKDIAVAKHTLYPKKNKHEKETSND
jgi:hypothetical protein